MAAANMKPREYVRQILSLPQYNVEEFNRSFLRLVQCVGAKPDDEVILGLYQAIMPVDLLTKLLVCNPSTLHAFMQIVATEVLSARHAKGLGAPTMGVDKVSVNRFEVPGLGDFVRASKAKSAGKSNKNAIHKQSYKMYNQRKNSNLCFCCGKPGHMMANCQEKEAR
ncbi:hypothetical protein IW142_003755 [Coemansia sp. RSA 564]|nr:hypothetical protein IW142_003755 [Coemansia sp. RSA 564]KAJ2425271.1 hypothetical protein IWW41_004442 [Coemansia sp. RSA 2522]